MNIERFKAIAGAIGFQQIEDEETLCQREGLPLEKFMALIEQIKQQGFNLTEIELRFADADFVDVITLTHDPDDETAFMELIEEEEVIES
jgi:hypothetical protein